MWSARGAYRNAEGRIVPLPERSPLWADKTELLKQVEHDHPGIKHIGKLVAVHGEWYRWVDEEGVERFVVIEEHESGGEMMDQVDRTKRRVGWFHWAVLFVGICMIVYGMNSDAVVQEVPVADSVAMQQLQAERDQARNDLQDSKRLIAQLQRMAKMSEATIAQLTDQLKALSVSVPSQPVILEAVRREAVTEKGLRQVVARNFGSEIAKRVRVE